MMSSAFFRTVKLAAIAAIGMTAFSASTVSAAETPSAVAVFKGPVVAEFDFFLHNTTVEYTGNITSGLTENGGYSYHIHKNPVPTDGNCTATGGHLDPFNRTGSPCTAETLDKCELGDLSGKFGKIDVKGNDTQAIPPFTFNDTTLSLSGNNSIIGRSIVFHAPNGTRLACANITAAGNSTGSKSGANGLASTSVGSVSITILFAMSMLSMLL